MRPFYQLLSLVYLFSLLIACESKKANLPELPLKGLKTIDLKSQMSLVFQLGFDEKTKVPFLEVEGEQVNLDYNAIADFVEAKEELVDYRMHRKIKPILMIPSNMPYQEVEFLMNCLRKLDYRNLFFAVTGGNSHSVACLSMVLPPATAAFEAAFQVEKVPSPPPTVLSAEEENSNNNNARLPPPPPPPPPPIAFQWNSVFYNKPAKALQLSVDGERRVLIDGKKIENLAKFIDQKIDKISASVPEGSRIGLYFWLDVSANTTYNNFLQTYSTLISIYKSRWNAMALQEHNREYNDLTRTEKRPIRSRLPLLIVGYGQVEYQYLKKLQEKDELDAFVKEHYWEF